jgi:predicted RNase H-like nuclease
MHGPILPCRYPGTVERVATRAVGVDACAGGWVAVGLVDGRVERVWSEATLPALLADVTALATIGIDLPLGGVASGWRAADLEAKRRLGAQHASVFSVPPRPVWDAPTYEVANDRCRDLTAKGLSRQAYGLFSRMLEAEEYRDSAPRSVHEVHPELVFRTLAQAPLRHGKKTWNGQQARRALLAGAGVVLADELPLVGAVPADDVLDAAAVAWCAQRIATGEARHVPDPPNQHDHRGRPIVIWAG